MYMTLVFGCIDGSLSNRRFAAFSMYWILHRDCVAEAWCKMCNNDTEELAAKELLHRLQNIPKL